MPLKGKKLGFIGFGKMAQAIWIGIEQKRLFNSSQVSFCTRTKESQKQVTDHFGLKGQSQEYIIKNCDIIIFCVKPQAIHEILERAASYNSKNKFFISIIAGIPLKTFQKYLGMEHAYLRCMLNTPAIVGESMTGLAFSDDVANEYKTMGKVFFSSVGQIELVEEKALDTVVGISASLVAILYRLMHRIATIGEEEGMDYEMALKFVSQAFRGAGTMLLELDKHPKELVEQVSSPDGATIAGLEVFNNSHIDEEIQEVILRMIRRTEELGKG